jgi:hypothetical protein
MRTSASRLKDGSGQICEPRAVSRLASRQLTAREPLTDNAARQASVVGQEEADGVSLEVLRHIGLEAV